MLAGKFDRVLSIEMFEHMKNYGLLFAKISRWIKPSGKLFVHVFAHKLLAYHFESQDDNDWMSRYFFTGGTMPRSEEHTSELQSLMRISYAVFCLQKKKY